MEPQSELILNVKKDIKKQFDIDINLNELSEDGQVYAELGAGYIEKKYVRGPGLYVYPVLFMCKSADEPYGLETLSKICNYYLKKRKPPLGETYSGNGLQVAAEPNKAGRQEDGQVLYSCIINFKIWY